MSGSMVLTFARDGGLGARWEGRHCLISRLSSSLEVWDVDFHYWGRVNFYARGGSRSICESARRDIMSGSGVVVAFLRPYFGRRGFGVVGICFVCRGARTGEGGSLFCLSANSLLKNGRWSLTKTNAGLSSTVDLGRDGKGVIVRFCDRRLC